MFRWLTRFVSIASLVAVPTVGQAAAASDQTAQASRPVLVELFTSQSCSSCVRAADYFRELASREEVVALAWHVDYWNALQTADGAWVDPFSDPAHTERQRAYNVALRASSAVYTPQIVVDGVTEAVASKRGDVDPLIEAATATPARGRISARLNAAKDTIEVAASGEGEAFIAYFMPEAHTQVTAGENARTKFPDIHAVTEAARLGAVSGETRFAAPAPKAGFSCAVFTQAPGQGAIVAAAYCEAE